MSGNETTVATMQRDRHWTCPLCSWWAAINAHTATADSIANYRRLAKDGSADPAAWSRSIGAARIL